MVRELTYLQAGMFMLENLFEENLKEKENIFMQMDKFTKENLKMESEKEEEYGKSQKILYQTYMMVSSKTI